MIKYFMMQWIISAHQTNRTLFATIDELLPWTVALSAVCQTVSSDPSTLQQASGGAASAAASGCNSAQRVTLQKFSSLRGFETAVPAGKDASKALVAAARGESREDALRQNRAYTRERMVNIGQQGHQTMVPSDTRATTDGTGGAKSPTESTLSSLDKM